VRALEDDQLRPHLVAHVVVRGCNVEETCVCVYVFVCVCVCVCVCAFVWPCRLSAALARGERVDEGGAGVSAPDDRRIVVACSGTDTGALELGRVKGGVRFLGQFPEMRFESIIAFPEIHLKT
jgi:hypothetical protein